MDKEYALKSIKKFLKELAKYIKINQAFLFGSWATGNAQEGSDIDLLIVSSDFRKMDFWDKVKLLGKIKMQLLEPIGAVGVTPEEFKEGNSLITEFAKQGQVVY
ncbi:MAG: nucleotidyltransferase domain-containing protein [bacterium]|nr:nucleotidyltransferase domain-containing protein [bacterium]